MNCYHVVLGDEDLQYSAHLSTYINTEKNFPIRIRSFSEALFLQNYIQEQSLDVLLISPTLYQELPENHHIKCVIILSSGKVPNDLSHLPILYKYQPIDRLIKNLLNIYSENHLEKIVQNENQTQIIGVFSPVGRSGRTLLSLALSAQLGKEKQVLYMNLEPFNCLSAYMRTGEQYGLSDVLYYVRKQHPNILLKLESIKESIEDFDYVGTVKCYTDLSEVQLEEWTRLIDLLKLESKYHVVVLNFSNNIYDYTIDFLEQCDHILMPMIPDQVSYKQIKSWYGALKLLNQESLLEKIRPIVNQVSRGDPLCPNFIESYKMLPYQEDLIRQQNDFYIDLHQAFGQAVRELIQEILVGEDNE